MVKNPQLLTEYTARLSPQRRERIESLHQFIVSHFPQVQISLKYKMPTYEIGEGWVSVASQKHYLSFYTCAREHILPYLDLHPLTKHGTGCLNFRDGDQIVTADLLPVMESAFKEKEIQPRLSGTSGE